ncbi:hypothetical protein PHISP_02286 [Aspergillus sp. HF37]|nr:hypothetical protein PHISP_02286 [Aspergillus sp. HF37]
MAAWPHDYGYRDLLQNSLTRYFMLYGRNMPKALFQALPRCKKSTSHSNAFLPDEQGQYVSTDMNTPNQGS